MRVNNKSTIPLFNFFIYITFSGIVIGALLYFFKFGYFIHPALTPIRLIIGSSAVILFIQMITPTQFEYISESEMVVLRKANTSVWGKISRKRPETLQFKKVDLKGFKIRRNMFFRILDVYLYDDGSLDKTIKHSFRMAFLEKKQVSNLKNSLHKIIRKNEKINKTEVREKV